MSKKKKKKRARLFYPIYFSLVIICIGAIWFFCMRWLNPRLVDYQKSDYKPAMAAGMRYFEEGDAETFFYFARQNQPDLFTDDDHDAYVAWMNGLIDGGTFTSHIATSANPDEEKKFNVRLNGQPFGSYTLRKVAASTEYGYDTWVFDRLDTINPEATEYTITAPSTALVLADGEPLTDDNIIEKGIPTVWTGHMLKEETPDPSMTKYAVTSFFGCPEISVLDTYDRPLTLTGDEDSGFTALWRNDDALQADTQDRVKEFVEAFSNFVAKDISTSKMLKYVRKGTVAYPLIEKFDNNWFGRHSSTKVQDLRMDHFIRFTDDTMACEVAYNHYVQFNDGDKTYPTAYRLYFVLRDGVWYLYDLEILDAETWEA